MGHTLRVEEVGRDYSDYNDRELSGTSTQESKPHTPQTSTGRDPTVSS